MRCLALIVWSILTLPLSVGVSSAAGVVDVVVA